MQQDPIQILEVRAGDAERPTTATAAVSADGSNAIFIALSEQLDRRRAQPMATADEVLAVRGRADLVERFVPLVSARASGVIQLTEEQLRDCLLDLSDYRSRVDGEHYQPLELRQRLEITGEVEAILWDANASVAAAAQEALNRTSR
jgi:hypothetical protein